MMTSTSRMQIHRRWTSSRFLWWISPNLKRKPSPLSSLISARSSAEWPSTHLCLCTKLGANRINRFRRAAVGQETPKRSLSWPFRSSVRKWRISICWSLKTGAHILSTSSQKGSYCWTNRPLRPKKNKSLHFWNFSETSTINKLRSPTAMLLRTPDSMCKLSISTLSCSSQPSLGFTRTAKQFNVSFSLSKSLAWICSSSSWRRWTPCAESVCQSMSICAWWTKHN